jgi:type I restriction enzyme S subunit
MTLREAGVSLIDCDHRTPPPSDEGYPYVAIPQLKHGHLDLSDARRITREHYEDWTRKAKPRQHDVILSRRCNPGETAVVPKGLECALGQNLVLLRADDSKMFPPFLRWLVRGENWWEQVGKFINVGAVFESLRCGDIPNFELPIPALAEQRAIAAVLGALDDKIELNRRMNETLEALAQSLFKSRFVDATQSALPKGWRETNLEDAIVIHDSKRIPLSSRERALRRGKYPYHGAASVMDYVDDYLFDGVYALMGEDGSVVNDDNTPILQYVWGKFWVNNHAHVLTGKNGVSVEHLLLFLKTVNIRPFVTGAVQPKLNQGNLCRVPFVLPPESVSKEFAGIIEPMFARIRANHEESRTLAALRDALLPKLLSGELRVPAAAKLMEACA